MRTRVLLYAGAMLITGTINTVSTKYQDMSVVGTKPDGSARLFQHPAFQSACMFLGEALCLIPYALLRWRKRAMQAKQPSLGLGRTPRVPMTRMFKIKRTMAFAIPTLCDATATTLLNVGLFYTFASTYQMLRGTLVLSTGLFTLLILKRRLFLHHWLGMVLIMAGAAIVGFASLCINTDPAPHGSPLLPPHSFSPGDSPYAATASRSLLETLVNPNEMTALHDSLWGASSSGSSSMGADASLGDAAGVVGVASGDVLPHRQGVMAGMLQLHWPGLYVQQEGAAWRPSLCAVDLAEPVGPMPMGPLFGDLMVILAQVFTALQFILEEKFLGSYRMQPLLAVGIEGAWGVILCLCALPFLSLVQTPDGQPLDDAAAAMQALFDVPSLRYAVLGSIMSIGLFNFFGLSVTQALSGASRATIDACRTLLVWLCSLALGWESFRQLQLVGFLVLLSGTSLYNELVRGCLPVNGGEEDEEDDEWMDPNREGGGPKTLQQPLLGSSGEGTSGGRPPRPTSRSISVAHYVAQPITTMARSVRLGFNALSPHDLADDEGTVMGAGMHGAVLPNGSADINDPMMLASTPYFGQGNLLAQANLADSRDVAVPAATLSDIEYGTQQVNAVGSGWGGPSRASGLAWPQQDGSGLYQPRTAGPQGGPPGQLQGPSSLQQPHQATVFPPPQNILPTGEAGAPGGGFLAFMAARTKTQQQEPPPRAPGRVRK